MTPSHAWRALWLAALMALAPEGVAEGDDVYRAGNAFAGALSGQGLSTLETMKPAEVIPNYTDRPPEKGYYDGVQANDANRLKTDGSTAWGQTDVGKAVTGSVIKNPNEPISPDAPFIQAGREIADKADSIVGKTGPDCQGEQVTRSTFTRHVCERDTAVFRTCERRAEIGGHEATRYEDRNAHIDRTAIRWWRDGTRVRGTFPAPFTGKLTAGAVHLEVQNALHAYGWPTTITVLGAQAGYGQSDWGRRDLGVGGVTLNAGQPVEVVITIQASGHLVTFLDALVRQLSRSGGTMLFHFDFYGSSEVRYWVPTTSVPPACALEKEAGAVKVNTECSEPGGERTVEVNGQRYTVSASCWRFTDTYRLQDSSEGNCGEWANNPACTVATHCCAFTDAQGVCLRENVTYSYEHRTTGEVMLCGGKMYCLNGECDPGQTGTQVNDFAHAVSTLAAVAAAGKDVSKLNGVDVRAFTGKGQSCRKAFAGFSDCCKDSGWGHGIGLAHCDDEEKALGKAKENTLTVSVGEYCSRKVLGVCLQKKRSYCQFDSKLAQIVQQQGRAWQLGIGFGDAESPNCRGITVDELQRIRFDKMDFANFYDDLMKNQQVPDSGALVEKVKQQIEQRMKEQR